MAEKKRFRIGNTTINLGLEDTEAICRFPTNGKIDCLYTNTATVLKCDVHHTFYPQCPVFYTQDICLYPTIDICKNRTLHIPTGGGGCGLQFSTLPTRTIHRTDTIGPIHEVPHENLQDIKENLLSQLKELEKYEESVKKSEVPQTREELDLLESELEHTLKEIKELKKDIK